MVDLFALKQHVSSICCFLTPSASGALSPRVGRDMIPVLLVADWRTDNVKPKAVIGRLIRKHGFVRIPDVGVHCGERLHPSHTYVKTTVEASVTLRDGAQLNLWSPKAKAIFHFS